MRGRWELLAEETKSVRIGSLWYYFFAGDCLWKASRRRINKNIPVDENHCIVGRQE